MTARPSILISGLISGLASPLSSGMAAALLALMLAGCQTTGASAPAAEAPAAPAFGKGKANSAALIGGALLGMPAQEAAAVPADRAREDDLLERWKHDRQFF